MCKIKEIVFILSLLLLVGHCIKNPVDDGNYFPTPAYPSPYSDPSWSADGKTIFFYRMKVTHITGAGNFSYDPDSTGIWAINADGTNMRLLLQGKGHSPELSPDGDWLVYEEGGQIYKARYVDGLIDTSDIVQLTTEGRNFFPAWSPDGQWIAYDSNVDNPSGGYSVRIMRFDGNNGRILVSGRMADWSPRGRDIIFIGFHNEIYRVDVNDTSKVERLTSLNRDNIYTTDNRYPQYSPDGNKIMFISKGICVMGADGTNLIQITNDAVTSKASWSPDGRIVYVRFISTRLNVNNGTLWIMNADGSNKWQLTYNHGLILE